MRKTIPFAGAVALAVLAAAGTARAQDRRPGTAPAPAPASAAGTLGPKKSVAPDQSLGGTLAPRAAERPAEVAPGLDYDAFRFRVEGQLSGKRREEMGDLEKLIALGGNPAEMPSWLFRLAELDWEESQYHFFEANRRDDALIRLGPTAPAAEVKRLQTEKKEAEARSRAYQDEAIARYKQILQEYPAYPRLDEVLFFLGENLWRQGKQKEALAAYKILVTKHEQSRYVPDAWMAFGEHYFETADKGGDRKKGLDNALKAYQRAASYKESSVYGFALYKQGWVYYNLARWADALDMFRAVMIFGDLPTTTITADRRLALIREARKDYVRTYSHIGSAEAAPAEFRKVGGEAHAPDMLRALADLYFGEGKDRESIYIYRQLIQARPLAPDTPLLQARVVTAAGRLGRKDIAVQEARKFVQVLADVEKAGTATDEKGKRQLEDARAAAENTLRTLAVQYHTEWKKTRDEPVAGLAAAVYEDYLKVFPEAPQAYDMRFFYAELLYALERYPQAGDEYTKVALQDARRVDAGEKPGKHMVDALEFAIHAYDVPAKRFEETEKRPATDAKTTLPIPPPKQQLLEASLRYRKYAPAGPKAVEVTYRAANIYYRYNHLPEATRLFTEIATQSPRHEVAGYAANLALDALNLMGDWKSVNEWARTFHGNAELVGSHPGLKEDLARVVEQSAFKLIEQQEKSKQYLAAADAYLSFAREWPQSRLAPTALYNASVDLVLARQLDRAAQVREELVTRYPGGSVVPKVLWANGADYESIADFDKAADFYERYYEGWKKERSGAGASAAGAAPRVKGKGKAAPAPAAPAAPAPAAGGEPIYEEAKARDALFNAGVFREGLRQLDRAEADRLAYVTSWPEGADSARVFLSIADLYARQKAWSKELKQLEDYQRRFARDPTEWIAIQGRIARTMEKAGNSGGARRAYAQALDAYRKAGSKVGERAMPTVAWASYLDLEGPFERFDRITLDVTPRYLKAQLEVKARKLAELQRAYTEIVNMKQAEAAVCALYRIGDGYRRFSRSLAEAPVPKELREMRRADVVAEYRNQLKQLSEGPQKKAAEGFDLALVKAREYAIWNDCARQAAEALARLDPEHQAAPPEVVPAITAPAAVASNVGYGLISTPQPPAPAPVVAAPAPALSLPPLRPAPAASQDLAPAAPLSAPAPSAARPPPAAAPSAAPAATPAPSPRPAQSRPPPRQPDRAPQPSEKDEDLLQ